MKQTLVDLMHIAAFFYVAMGVTWIYFLAVMNLKRHIHILKWWHLIWALPAVAIFVVIDAAFNIIVGTILYLELPPLWNKEFLFTTRCHRHVNGPPNDWRTKEAKLWCTNFLNPFDPTGKHCA